MDEKETPYLTSIPYLDLLYLYKINEMKNYIELVA